VSAHTGYDNSSIFHSAWNDGKVAEELKHAVNFDGDLSSGFRVVIK
jgi:hypothetical protein